MGRMAFRGFLPMMNRCLVRRAVAETNPAGGIMLPETSQSKLNVGEVLAIGEGLRVENGNLIPIPSRSEKKSSFPNSADPKSSSKAKSLCCTAIWTFWANSNEHFDGSCSSNWEIQNYSMLHLSPCLEINYFFNLINLK